MTVFGVQELLINILRPCSISCNTGVTVTVDDSMRYMVNEDEGLINITILLDQPSCVPITVIATPLATSAQSNYM